MIGPDISAAILNRIKADTGTGGLYSASGGTTWATITRASAIAGNPASLSLPYLTWDIDVENEGQNTMNGLGAAFVVTFSVWASVASTTAEEDVRTVFHRLIGDAMLSSGTRTVPTYGFHNHKLVLPSNTQNAEGSDMWLVSNRVGMAQDPNYYEGVIQFKGGAWAAAVNV